MYILFKKVAAPVIIVLFLFSTFLVAPFSHASEDETTYYFLTDHLGSVDVVLDEDGNVIERRDYQPYGAERLHIEEADKQDEAYGFTGQEQDEETGLHYYTARYYDSEIGRFLSVDPLVLDEAVRSDESLMSILDNPQYLNAYTYALNNPVLFIDIFGESVFTERFRGAGRIIDGAIKLVTGVSGAMAFSASVPISAGGIYVGGKGVTDVSLGVMGLASGEKLDLPKEVSMAADPVKWVIKETIPPPLNEVFIFAYDYDYYERGLEAAGELIENAFDVQNDYNNPEIISHDNVTPDFSTSPISTDENQTLDFFLNLNTQNNICESESEEED